MKDKLKKPKSEEHKKALSEAQKGHKLSEETGYNEKLKKRIYVIKKLIAYG